jgi:hypothetical protein
MVVYDPTVLECRDFDRARIDPLRRSGDALMHATGAVLFDEDRH